MGILSILDSYLSVSLDRLYEVSAHTFRWIRYPWNTLRWKLQWYSRASRFIRVKLKYPTVAHPRCNGQVERANGMVLQVIKDHIFDDASPYTTLWVAELPHVIWGLQTQVSSATGYSPFFLDYGSEAICNTMCFCSVLNSANDSLNLVLTTLGQP
jgi:hypothetical protein